MAGFVSLTGSSEVAAARGRLGRFDATARLVTFAELVQPRMTQAITDAAPRGKGPPSGPTPGRLATSTRSSHKVGPGVVTMEWHSDVPYAPYVLKATRPHDIAPVRAKALHWITPDGAHHFSQRTHHPGSKPFDYPRVALRAQMPWIAATFHSVFERI